MLVNPDLALEDEIDWLGPQKKRRAAPEAAIQRAIRERLMWLGLFSAHVPNEGRRDPRTGKRLRGEGMRAGFPDLIVIGRGNTAYLEVKAPGGRLSQRQIECHADMRLRGAFIRVVTSQDEAVAACREAGLLP